MQTPSYFRPQRFRIHDEMGRLRTLDSGPLAFELVRAGNGGGTLLLGLGPDPAALSADSRFTPPIFWVECPAFEAAMPASWHAAIPPGWTRVSFEALHEFHSCSVLAYRANVRLFPSFWGPLAAAVRFPCSSPSSSSCLPPRPDAAEAAPVVLLPGSEDQLLTRELELAFGAEGFTPIRVPDGDISAVRRILADTRPALYFSVNFRGMDADGSIFHLLGEAGVPVAAWLVDNPWHVLSRFRQPWWRQVALFVTDSWFLPGLVEYGARFARHLPLAAWNMPAAALPGSSLPLTPLAFVGRVAFPDKRTFFSGCSLPEHLLAEARLLLGSSTPPDLGWWLSRLSPICLWPGNEVRTAGLGAETASAERRALWLQHAAPLGLTVYGDCLWKSLLPPSTTVLPPVDYYSGLGGIYAAARYSLNITSLQLPGGLTQRHFDVWQCGGFLLSDAVPGLALFPAELTEAISLPAPSQILTALERFEREPLLRLNLQCAWRAHLAEHHTYGHRVRHVLESLV